jgi:glycosyltransferase involved in cell wall biosynthesis
MVIAATLVSLWHLRRRYEVIQVNTIPDSLVFAALGPRLLGARVLLDLHECMPEFFSTKFDTHPHHPIVRLVGWVEQAAIRFADLSITSTEPMREAFIGRGAPANRISVVLNSYGLNLGAGSVHPRAQRDGRRFTLICHGTIDERYGLDTLVRAVALVKDELPDLELVIYGDGPYRPALQSLVAELTLEGRVRLSDGWAPAEDLLQAIAGADAGVVAIKQNAFRDLTLCNKMWDFIGLRKPAIVSRTRSVEEYFGDSCFRLFTAGDAADLARAIRDLYANPVIRRRLVQRAAQVAEQYAWARSRARYLHIVDRLAQGRIRTGRRGAARLVDEPEKARA